MPGPYSGDDIPEYLLSEYASTLSHALLLQHGMHARLSRKGDCSDHAMMESFWAPVKEGCCGVTIFEIRDEAQAAIFHSIEVYSQRKRLHSS